MELLLKNRDSFSKIMVAGLVLTSILFSTAVQAQIAPSPWPEGISSETELVSSRIGDITVYDLEFAVFRVHSYYRILYNLAKEKRKLLDKLTEQMLLLAENDITTESDPLLAARIQKARYFCAATPYMFDLKRSITVDTAEIEAYYQEHIDRYKKKEEAKVYQIFSMTRETAEIALAELKAGGSFEVTARKYSEDDWSRPFGGCMGYVKRGKMIPEFYNAAFSLPFNQFSGVLKTGFGYHVIMVTDRRQITRPLKDVRQEVANWKHKEKQHELIQQVLAEAKGSREVVINEENIQKIADEGENYFNTLPCLPLANIDDLVIDSDDLTKFLKDKWFFKNQRLFDKEAIENNLQEIINNILLGMDALSRGYEGDQRAAIAMEQEEAYLLKEARMRQYRAVKISEQDLRDYYDQATSEVTHPESRHLMHACFSSRKSAEVFIMAVRMGGDFLSSARAAGSANADKCDIGFIVQFQMHEKLGPPAFALTNPGDLTDVIKTEYGFHVLQLVEIREAKKLPFEACAPNLEKMLSNRNARKMYDEWLSTMKIRYDVVFHEEIYEKIKDRKYDQ